MKIPQLELPDYIANRLGGLRIIAAQTQWYFSLPQFLAIMGLAYYRFSFLQNLPIIGETIWTWIGFMFVAGTSTFVFHYSLIFPAMQKFNQNQSQREERSPLYRRVLENQEDIKEIKKEVKIKDKERCPVCQNNLKKDELGK